MSNETIVVSGTIRIEPADRDAALALIRPLVAGTHAEPGCIEYAFWADPEDAGRFRVFEEWRSADDLAAHGDTPHYQAFNSQLATGTVRVLGVELHRYTIAAKQSL